MATNTLETWGKRQNRDARIRTNRQRKARAAARKALREQEKGLRIIPA